jgi:hypothetical protein
MGWVTPWRTWDGTVDPSGKIDDHLNKIPLKGDLPATTNPSSLSGQSYDQDAQWVWHNILKEINEDSVQSVRNATDRWKRIAVAAEQVYQDLSRIVGSLTEEVWRGRGQKQFHDTAERIVNFAKSVRDTAMNAQQNDPSSFYKVSDGLAGSMDKAVGHLYWQIPHSSYTNGGKKWEAAGDYKFSEDKYWGKFASNTYVTFRRCFNTVITPFGCEFDQTLTLSQLESDCMPRWWVFEKNPFFTMSNWDKVNEWVNNLKVNFLNHQQKVLFNSLATNLSQEYAHYYGIVPPAPRWVDKGGSTGSPDFGGPDFGGAGFGGPDFGGAGFGGAGFGGADFGSTGFGGAGFGGADFGGAGFGGAGFGGSGLPATGFSGSSPSFDQMELDDALSAGPSSLSPLDFGDGAMASVTPAGMSLDGMPTSLAGVDSAVPGLGLSGLTTPGLTTSGLTTPGTASTLPGSVRLPGTLGAAGSVLPGNLLAREMQAGRALAGQAALAEQAALAGQAAALRGGVGGMMPPMYPPMGGMAGAGQPQEPGATNFLVEDEDFWSDPTNCPPPVIGFG